MNTPHAIGIQRFENARCAQSDVIQRAHLPILLIHRANTSGIDQIKQAIGIAFQIVRGCEARFPAFAIGITGRLAGGAGDEAPPIFSGAVKLEQTR